MDKLDLWRKRIKDRECSGLTINDWCSQNNINPATYASWKTKVKLADVEKYKKPVFVEVDSEIKQSAQTVGELKVKWHDFEFYLS